MVRAVNNYLCSILAMLQSYIEHNRVKIQLDEPRAHKPLVAGSNPAAATSISGAQS